MGCGHSKINNYRKKMRDKALLRKYGSPTQETTDEGIEDSEETRHRRVVNENEDIEIPLAKPFLQNHVDSFGPIRAPKQLSASQTNFFKMLDEKIENGPDYDSSSETEKALEDARLTTLLKDWETASAGSRSLPSTPKKNEPDRWRPAPVRRPHLANRLVEEAHGRVSMHQYYSYYNPPCNNQNPAQPVQQPPSSDYGGYTLVPNPALQQPTQRQFSPPLMKNIPQSVHQSQIPRYPSPSDLIQQQIYNQKLQYQQAVEYQQLRQAREQQLLDHQQHQQQLLRQNRTYENIVRIPYNQNADGHYYELA